MSIVMGRAETFNLKSSLYDRVNPNGSGPDVVFLCCAEAFFEEEAEAEEGPAEDDGVEIDEAAGWGLSRDSGDFERSDEGAILCSSAMASRFSGWSRNIDRRSTRYLARCPTIRNTHLVPLTASGIRPCPLRAWARRQ